LALARIGLGANVGHAVANVERAIAALSELGHVATRSRLYRTRAWGFADQADFVNAAVLLETTLAPRELLARLKELERRLGRVETARWGPRAIDLDILAYDDLTIDEEELVIPHRRLFERGFALGPLAEVDEGFRAAFEALPPAEREGLERIGPRARRSRGSVDWDRTLERVREAAEFCASAGLARFRVEEGDLAIEVRRTPRAAQAHAEPVAETVPAANGTHSGNGVAPGDGRNRVVLKAEFVGIVRLTRPAVSEGTLLSEDRELAFVESLGIRNPIRAKGPGRVAAIFVSDGQPVEYGQPLFAIEE